MDSEVVMIESRKLRRTWLKERESYAELANLEMNMKIAMRRSISSDPR